MRLWGILLILFVILSLGCTQEPPSIKYVCSNGSVVELAELCEVKSNDETPVQPVTTGKPDSNPITNESTATISPSEIIYSYLSKTNESQDKTNEFSLGEEVHLVVGIITKADTKTETEWIDPDGIKETITYNFRKEESGGYVWGKLLVKKGGTWRVNFYIDGSREFSVSFTVVGCEWNDGICPTPCTILTDNDCSANEVGVTVKVDENLEITILSNPTPKRYDCWTYYSSKYTDDIFWGYKYRTKMRFENSGNTLSDEINSHQFKLYDSVGVEYSSTSFLSGNCEQYEKYIFDGQKILPHTRLEKEVWFDLGEGSVPAPPYIVIYEPDMLIEDNEVSWQIS